MAISKIILNGVTQMDLTQDTVASENLISPNTAHDAAGLPVVGSASSGLDVPTFEIEYDSNWDISSITCNKTFAECYDIINNNEEGGDVAYIHEFLDDPNEPWEAQGIASNSYTIQNQIIYTRIFGVHPAYDIVYHNNNNIEIVSPSAYDLQLNATTNGYYIPSGVYTSVNVNVTPSLQTKSVTYTPSTSQQTDTVTAGSGYDGLSQVSVTVNAMPSGTAGTPTATKGSVSNNSVSVTPSVTNTTGYITGGTKTGTAVSVSASELVSGTKSISANGTGIDVTNYASVDVAVSPSLQTKSATPTESAQMISPDSGYDGLSSVSVGAIDSEYVGSDITRRSSTDLTASGATVSVPAGYYESAASKAVSNGSATTPATTVTANPSLSIDPSTGVVSASVSATKSVTPTVSAGYVSSGTAGTITVSGSDTLTLSTQAAATITPSTSQQTAVAAGKYTTGNVVVSAMPSGSAGTPTATKGTVSNHAVTVTPSVTNTTGYITGGTKTGTAVSVSASELVSGSETKTENGTYDVTNLETLVVNVQGSSAKNVQAYLGYVSRTANSYGATNVTLTVAKTGTYKISWCAWRSSSSGTMGTNLHIGNTTGTNQQTWTGTYGQCITLSNQSLTSGTVLTLYATSGSNSRSVYVGNLIIEEQ